MNHALQLLQEKPEVLEGIVEQYLLNKQRIDASKIQEPTDANVVPNPNLHKRLPYPMMLHHHGTRSTIIVQNEQEHREAVKAGHTQEPIPEKTAVEAPKQEVMSSDTEERFAALEEEQQRTQALLAEILNRLTPQAAPVASGPTFEWQDVEGALKSPTPPSAPKSDKPGKGK